MSCCSERVLFNDASSIPSIISAVYVDTPIHVKGDRTSPYLYIIVTPPAGTSFTFRYWIADINGVVLSDVKTDSFPPGTQVSRYPIGSWIDDQRTAKNIPPGMYLLVVHETYGGTAVAIPIFLVTNRITIPREDYLEQIIVYDVTTGAMLSYPPTIGFAPADDRYIIFKYYHDGKRGRLVKLKNDGSVEWDTGYVRYAIVKNTIKFSSTEALLYYMFTRSVGFPHELVSYTVTQISLGNYGDVLKILKPYYRSTLMLFGRLNIEVDLVNNEIRETVGMYFGFIDVIQKVVMGAMAGCVGGGILGALVGSVVPGLGTAVGAKVGCLIGMGGAVLYTLSEVTKQGETKTEQDVRETLENISNEAKRSMEEEKNEADKILKDLVEKGIISKEVYEKIMNHINKMYQIAVETMDKLVEEGVKAYQEGYKRGVAESKKWIALAGFGGTVFGFLLGRR